MNLDQPQVALNRETSKTPLVRSSNRPSLVSGGVVTSGPAVALAALVFIALAGAALAQDGPAVSEVNGKLSYAGGNMNSAEGHNFDGSIALPLTRQFGFQADGLYSRISDLDFGGGAGHLFWRDPKIGLLGVTGGYLGRAGVQTYQAGAEGEYIIWAVSRSDSLAAPGPSTTTRRRRSLTPPPPSSSGGFPPATTRWTTCLCGFPA